MNLLRKSKSFFKKLELKLEVEGDKIINADELYTQNK